MLEAKPTYYQLSQPKLSTGSPFFVECIQTVHGSFALNHIELDLTSVDRVTLLAHIPNV